MWFQLKQDVGALGISIHESRMSLRTAIFGCQCMFLSKDRELNHD